MGRLDDQVAWITGGGSGIGRALALALAAEGAAVAVSGRRRDKLDETAAAIREAGGTALVVPCDVTVEPQVEAAVSTVVDLLGRLDVVVANAGYAALGAVERTDLDVWRRQLEVNLIGAVATAKHALPELRRTRGRLALVGSVAAFVPIAKQGPYVTSKAAVAALGATLAVEVAGSGVSVTTLHPGFVDSDIAQVDALGRHVGGRTDARPRLLLWDADRAARVMVEAIVARERERVFTGHGRIAATIGRHAPGVVHHLLTARAPRTVAPPPDEALGPLELTAGETITLTAAPSTLRLFGGAVLAARGKPQGELDGDAFPALRAVHRGVRVAPERVAAYREVCGEPGPDDVLPLTLPEILFLGPMGAIATHPRFPLSPFGLIHVRQTITGHRALRADEVLDLTAYVAEVRRTAKGYEIDLGLVAACGAERPWQAVTTLLSRAPGVAARAGARKGTGQVPEGGTPIRVPADTGRRYAAVSGDHNPHHLWALTARPLGYRRPIAHGMWSLARLLGELPPEVDGSTGHVEARFLRPIAMPGTMQVAVGPGDDGWSLRAWDPKSGAPHVDGTYVPVA